MSDDTKRSIPEQGDIFGESGTIPDKAATAKNTAPESDAAVPVTEIPDGGGKSGRNPRFNRGRKSKKDEPFEKLLGRLEEIVEAMEGGGLPLEDMMKLYEEGVQKAETLTAMLADARTRVMKLVKNENGKSVPEPFEGDESQ